MRRSLKRRQGNKNAADLNITAFMNLMVVLVPFLLITAVFSRMTILELNLPAPGKTANNQMKPAFEIKIVIRPKVIEVVDNRGGLLQRIPKFNGKYNTKALSNILQQVKARFPNKTNASILASPNTNYETLVLIMDTVRSYKAKQDGEYIHAELFPDIAIGDAS